MGASPHLPHTEGVCSLYILPLPYPARPPRLQASCGGGLVYNSFNRGAPKFSPNPPILRSKLGAQGSWGEQVRLTQALPGSWPASAASSTPHLEGCSQPVPLCSFTPKGVKLAKSCRRDSQHAPGPSARGIQLQHSPQPVFLLSLARRACAGCQLVSSLGAAVGKSGAVGCRCAVGRVAGSLGSGWLTRKHFSLCAFSMLEKRKRWPHTSHG